MTAFRHSTARIDFGGSERPFGMSMTVPACPLLSKDLDDGATRGRLHSDLLDTALLCTEAFLSIQVQSRPTLPREVLCTEPRIGLRPRTFAQPRR